MTRSYKNVRTKKHFVYNVDDLVQLFGVHKNTVSNWVTEGLLPSDQAIPYVFNGTEVKRFHDARRLGSKGKLRTGEFKCFKCKNRVVPEPPSISVDISKSGFFCVWGACPICACVVNKRVNAIDCDRLLKCQNTNTTLASLDEVHEQVPVGIVTDELSETTTFYTANDRILFEWQKFAGSWDKKTVNAKLASIRQFEAFVHGKAFDKLTTTDVSRFREHLKVCVETRDEHRRSKSTVRHCASHLKSFLAWLVDQKGYQGLNNSLPDHCKLPKKFETNGLEKEDRAVPNDTEAVAMISSMATDTSKARRDRAMVAIAFLAALRADTITSLLVGHVEVANRIIVQDGTTARAKNGKSLRINWFPLPQIFEDIVVNWLKELLDLGCKVDDALFPDDRSLRQRCTLPHEGEVPVMSSTHAVSVAFRAASGRIGKKFSPHSAKHYIGVLGLKMCKTVKEEASWSANMGHEGMEITRRYYQKPSQACINDVFERFNRAAETEDTIDDMELMLLYHEHSLVKGTPEFERARKLVQARAAHSLIE